MATKWTNIQPEIVKDKSTQEFIKVLNNQLRFMFSRVSAYSLTGTLSIDQGGTGSSLTDPGADRMFFWDESVNNTAWLACGNSIAITGTTLDTIQDIRASASPTFTGLTLSGLTASRLLASDGAKALSSVADLTAWVSGTANRLIVTNDGDGTITLDINTTLLPSPGAGDTGKFFKCTGANTGVWTAIAEADVTNLTVDLGNKLDKNGINGSFTTTDGKTITVIDGQITAIT